MQWSLSKDDCTATCKPLHTPPSAALARDKASAHQRKVDGGKSGTVMAQRAALVARVPPQVLAALLPGYKGRAARSRHCRVWRLPTLQGKA